VNVERRWALAPKVISKTTHGGKHVLTIVSLESKPEITGSLFRQPQPAGPFPVGIPFFKGSMSN
jgi:hypothetical protein